MSTLRESTGVRVPSRLARGGVVLLAATALLVSACGSAGKESSGASETTAPVAGAQENSIIVPNGDTLETVVTVAPVASNEGCRDWPAGTTVVPCAVGAMGPGGGRVFYDAGSKQAWGRYLEVAPQAWTSTLWTCRSCATASGVSNQTSDRGRDSAGYYPCREGDSTARLLPGEAADTLWEIGGGRHNTEVLSKTPECVDGSVSPVTLAAGYRGGGLSDWYLPSGGELTELCKYTGRNAIGGFVDQVYASSTVGPKDGYTNFHQVKFTGNPLCVRSDGLDSRSGSWIRAYVRPIRAFS